ncbi:hypothetical protein [Mesorhizobium sp. M0296]|uniref:hypothetical protein n=1 Tax=Mesorhizobium sp. M0296 TaxID=2956931 RepID=UPI0033361C75
MDAQAVSVQINSTLFWIGGGVIFLAALLAIITNRAVSTGHSLMIAIGAAVVLVPYVSNFEWSDKSIKFTTRLESAALTRNVADTAQNEVQVRSQLTELAAALKAATDRIAALEASTGHGTGTQNGGLTGLTLQEFMKQNDWAKDNAQKRFDNLLGLEQQLTRPAM